jgi:hypothetical protein
MSYAGQTWLGYTDLTRYINSSELETAISASSEDVMPSNLDNTVGVT